MTDSMKFGPEWLRNLSTDSSTLGGFGGNSGSNPGGNNSGHSTANSSSQNHNNNNNHHITNHGSSTNSAPRNMFPEFRYGREEMLSIFDKNCNMPEILPLFKKIYVEKAQIPLALTPSTDDEITTPITSNPTAQRPIWMQRSPLGFSSSVRGIGRGGERGRMRGKSTYHSAFQRPQAMFEEDLRSNLLKSERNWYERNGAGGGGDANIGHSNSGGAGTGTATDWNGGSSPHTSPRREFSNHTRNMENWRRNRNEDGAGEPSTEGWRNPSSTHTFGSVPRWGRSTSWRDEEAAAQVDQHGGILNSGSSSNMIQRSLSNVSTSLAGNAAVKSTNISKPYNKTSAVTSQTANKSNQWTIENSSDVARAPPDGEDNLPEWATDVPLGTGGSFDASGAFHGSNGDEVGDQSGDDKKFTEQSKTSPVSNASNSDNKNVIVQEKGEVTQEKSRLLEPTASEKQPNESASQIIVEKHSNYIEVSSNLESSQKETIVYNQKMLRDPHILQGQRRLSDHMIEAADDMVKKLINDDDIVGEIGKNLNVSNAFDAANIKSIGNSNNLETVSLPHSKMMTIVSNSDDSATAAPHKGLLYYSDIAQSTAKPHIQQQQQQQFPPSSIIPNEAPPTPLSQSNGDLWYYRDPQSRVQGPFTALEMTEWYTAGYFNENLLVRRACDSRFRPLGDLIKTCQANMPFTHSSLLANANMETVSIHPKDQCEELKGSVTAAADTLSAAVKNLNSVDMLPMLNLRFQMLQEQYMRKQELAIIGELMKNEGFLHLTPSEQEAVVRQKAQIHGLPEYLTSLTSLGNILATLNPTAGTQLFNAIRECTKKDNQQPPQQIFPQPPMMPSSYMDIGEFMVNVQRQQQQQQQHQHQQQLQQQQQPQPQLPHSQHQHQHLARPPQANYNSFDANVVGSENLSNNALMNEMNLRMLLAGGNNAHSPQPAGVSQQAASQDLIGNANSTGGYLREQQILAARAAAVTANQSPLMQMWLPSPPATSNILPTSVHAPPLQQSSQSGQPQWNAGGPLVGISNVISATNVGVGQQLSAATNPVSTSTWNVANNEPSINNDPLNEDVSILSATNKMPKSSFDDDSSNNKTPRINNLIDVVEQMSTQSENTTKDLSISEEAVKQQQQQQQQLNVNKKQKQNLASTSTPKASKDDFKKVDAEEKRRQKEERKRQQTEEEKRRLQQAEQEKLRQLQEEQERQKKIQVQRRKAMLGSNNGNSASSSTQKQTSRDHQKMQSSIAPWCSTQSSTATNSPTSLAEIQKAERRERRADQQRQMELLEKQVRLNSAAADSTDSGALKWNPSPVQVKSIAEIQAEEAKRLNYEAHVEAQRRKDQERELQAALNISNVNNSNSFGGSNKFWSSNSTSNANTLASGFWEEPSKVKTSNVTATGGTTFAAAISSGKQVNQQKQQNTTSVPSRNLKKSQTVSVMQSTTNNPTVPKNLKTGGPAPPASISNKQQANNNKPMPTADKKAGANSKSNGSSSGNSSGGNKDEYENEFINWCMKSLSNMSSKVDVPTFVTFLRDLESPYEVKDYVRMYLGESKEFTDFAKHFLERRSKYKNLQRAQNAHNDDMCKPAPAITPSAVNENSDTKNKQKKMKKNKMTKLDTRILGFSVTAAEGRINVGDRDYVDAP